MADVVGVVRTEIKKGQLPRPLQRRLWLAFGCACLAASEPDLARACAADFFLTVPGMAKHKKGALPALKPNLHALCVTAVLLQALSALAMDGQALHAAETAVLAVQHAVASTDAVLADTAARLFWRAAVTHVTSAQIKSSVAVVSDATSNPVSSPAPVASAANTPNTPTTPMPVLQLTAAVVATAGRRRRLAQVAPLVEAVLAQLSTLPPLRPEMTLAGLVRVRLHELLLAAQINTGAFTAAASTLQQAHRTLSRHERNALVRYVA
jgi:hypothetical protein